MQMSPIPRRAVSKSLRVVADLPPPAARDDASDFDASPAIDESCICDAPTNMLLKKPNLFFF
jgi:hypothetical protein